MEALSVEAGGAISATDLKVDVERRGGLNICPFLLYVGCGGADARALAMTSRILYSVMRVEGFILVEATLLQFP